MQIVQPNKSNIMHKIKRLLPVLFLAVAAATFVAGCVASNPNYPTSSPDPYIVSPAVTNISDSLRATHTITQPINPAAPLTAPVLEYSLGIAAAVAAWLAKRKNDEAKAQKAAADSMAETIVARGVQVDALKAAGANGVIEAVASHIDRNTLS